MKKRAGFTLIEVLLGIAIFAIGGVALLALFFAHFADATRAADTNRALEISSSVRSTLEASLRSPITVQFGNTSKTIYPFAFPFASLENLSPRASESVTSPDPSRINDIPTYFFELPTEPWRGWEPIQNDPEHPSMEILPRDLLGQDGRPLNTQAKVWYYKPTALTLQGYSQFDAENVDIDERDAYAFQLLIRRSVSRTHMVPPGAVDKPLLSGLYVCHLRVFKGYDPAESNEPIFEIDLTLNSAE